MREATTLICQEHDLVSDIAYGKTKVFIRSPQTLTALEQERVAMLPEVAIVIQKVKVVGWSGVMGWSWVVMGSEVKGGRLVMGLEG